MLPRLFVVFLVVSGSVAGVAQEGVLHRSYAPLEGRVAHELALLHHTNEARARAGRPALRLDDALTLAARHHAAEMARLRYMSHESPNPDRAFASQRVALAGSAVRSVGENLARVTDDAQAPATAVGVWMDSPGHRANLLDPRFTHVGFGTAANGRGQLYAVQVLARQPLELVAADVRRVSRDATTVRVAVEVRASSEVSLGYGEERLPPRTLPAGSHVLAFPHASTAPVHLRIGVRPAGASGFIGQDGGWFDPVRGSWDPSGTFPKRHARITGVARASAREEVERISLAFAQAPPHPLGVWIDGEPWPATDLRGRELVIELPVARFDPVIGIGLQEPGGGGRYAVVLGLTLRFVDGATRLVPHAGR